MSLSAEAQNYKEVYARWDELGSQEVDPSLAPLIDTARAKALGIMGELAPQILTELSEVAQLDMSISTARKSELLAQLEEVIRLSGDLLDAEDIEAQRQSIEAQFTLYKEEDVTFAKAFNLAHGLTQLGKRSLWGREEVELGSIGLEPEAESAIDSVRATEDAEVVGLPECHAVEEDTHNPEYKGQVALLEHMEALMIVSTLIGRGEKVNHIREDGIDIPSEGDLFDMWSMLKDSLEKEDKETIDYLFYREGATNNDRNALKESAVRGMRMAAANRIVEIIEAEEIGQQYEYLLTCSQDVDPRCVILDFLDGIEPSQIPYMRELLSRVADPTIPVINMAGRVVGVHQTIMRPGEVVLETIERGWNEAGATIYDGDHDCEEVKDRTPEVIVSSTSTVMEFYKAFGFDEGTTIDSTALQSLHVVSSYSSLVAKAKSIKGLLSDGACKSSRKARFTVEDVIALSVLSSIPTYFNKLEGLSEDEQRELRSTKPRDLKKAIAQAITDYRDRQLVSRI